MAFFDHQDPNDHDVLYVGSVKTVIGHTEGTAGLAGILKACMALQHATIPANFLFNRLSPEVAPFYKNLRILNSPQPWPSLPDGVPRRASVNSFGTVDSSSLYFHLNGQIRCGTNLMVRFWRNQRPRDPRKLRASGQSTNSHIARVTTITHSFHLFCCFREVTHRYCYIISVLSQGKQLY